VACLLLLAGGCGSKPEKARHYTIGIVNLNPQLEQLINSFKQSMRQRGYIAGQNVTYLYRSALPTENEVDKEVQTMISSGVDLLFTLTTPVTMKSKQAAAAAKIPVLFGPAFAPVDSGIVDSLSHPGANVTGIQMRGSTAKALEWFLAAVPSTRRIFVPFHSNSPTAVQNLEDLRRAADHFQIVLVTKNVNTEQELAESMAAIPEHVDAVWITHSYFIVARAPLIIEAATARNLPVGSSVPLRNKGVLLSYSVDHAKIGDQAARMADRLLHGVPAADIPVETTDYFLSINLKTARSLGIHIPEDVLNQADFIIRQ
jgi:putative ABC transport system substrate-binding protein